MVRLKLRESEGKGANNNFGNSSGRRRGGGGVDASAHVTTMRDLALDRMKGVGHQARLMQKL
jgi:hypothetical protein